MKLGIVPLRSIMSLKMIFNLGHILVKNRTRPKAIYNPWFFMILGQNSTYSKMDVIGMLHSC